MRSSCLSLYQFARLEHVLVMVFFKDTYFCYFVSVLWAFAVSMLFVSMFVSGFLGLLLFWSTWNKQLVTFEVDSVASATGFPEDLQFSLALAYWFLLIIFSNFYQFSSYIFPVCFYNLHILLFWFLYII